MPPPHRLCDFDLENRVRMNWEWIDEDKLHFAERAKRMMMITDEDILRADEDLSVYLNEEKQEDYEQSSYRKIVARYFVEKILSFEDYRMKSMFPELLCRKQRMTMNSSYPSLIAIQEEEEKCEMALNVTSVLSNETWIGDTGASVHMKTTLDGMSELKK